ncbi:uncharacterized protein LOC119072604 [Bradysia coprophila]|uniref:uncharacterized protein LOC119072604 n=1 Tax=Bradysia coprophila TaxID=38358 RepID=UPI00187DCAD9|nr:uncharacterized protein LOC119072604 [Bradysia coprophila]
MMNKLKIFIALSFIHFTSTVTVVGSVLKSKPSAVSCRALPNEEYALDPYRCQETCDKYGDPSCPDYAPDGDCYCRTGYLRLEADGKCVPMASPECRAKMPPTKEMCVNRNEEFREYLYDEPCPNTCDNVKVPCHFQPPNVMVWSPHCVCKDGYSRLPNGNCVPTSEPECEELWQPSVEQCKRRGNEIFDWRSACQTTCEEIITNEQVRCTSDVVIDCFCPDGLVRLVKDGECVDVDECFPVKIRQRSIRGIFLPGRSFQ